MNIFLLAPEYLGLYKPILDELVKQRHSVKFFPDYGSLKKEYKWAFRMLYKIRFLTLNPQIVYWKKIIKAYHLKNRYDIFICINGISFHPYLLSVLKSENPNMKTILYCWDSEKWQPLLWKSSFFDKTFTFDYSDSINWSVNFLPFYWSLH